MSAVCLQVYKTLKDNKERFTRRVSRVTTRSQDDESSASGGYQPPSSGVGFFVSLRPPKQTEQSLSGIRCACTGLHLSVCAVVLEFPFKAGLEQPGLVESVPAHARGVELDEL